MTWAIIWRTITPFVVIGCLVYFLSHSQWDKAWRLVAQVVIFYMLWLSIQYLKRLFDQGKEAFQRLAESDAARTVAMEDLTKRLERQEERQAHIARELADRQTILAEGAAKTALASKHVEHTLATINKKLDDNMEATVKAAEASTEAVVLANTVNDKVATRDDLVSKLEELFKTAKPRKRDA